MRLNPAARDPITIADWAEIQILYSGSGSIAFEAVRTEIDKDGSLEDELEEEAEELGQLVDWPENATERLLANGESEILRRIEIADNVYPFQLIDGTLGMKPDSDKYLPYIFCLLACDSEMWDPADQRQVVLLEHLAREVLEIYLGGTAIRFGTPRDTMPDGLHDAIEELASLSHSRVAGGYPTNDSDNDLGLDVAGWKDFPDGNTSILQVYLQCTVQQSWEGKKGEPDMEKWSGVLSWPFRPTKGMAIPWVVNGGDDWHRASSGTLLFDRLRLALTLDNYPDRGIDDKWSEWCQQRIANGKTRFYPVAVA